MVRHNYHKLLFTVIALVIFSLTASSQTTPKTPEELQAFIKDMQRKADSVQKAMKGKQNPGVNTTSQNTSIKPGQSDAQNKFDAEIPKKDLARLQRISGKNSTTVQNYFKQLNEALSKKLPKAVAPVQAATKTMKDSVEQIGGAAITAWMNGNLEEAVLLGTHVASLPNVDGITLSNVAAILDMAGLSEYAIPINRTILRHDPENAMVLNNIGQAFTNLGVIDSAMLYFGRCLSISPQHPEANHTAGVIELKRGNEAKAQAHFENSIRGGFTHSAYLGLKSILKDKCRIRHLVKPKVKYPDYFNQFKYKLPRQCQNVYEAATRKAEFNDFKKMLNATLQKYRRLEKEQNDKKTKEWVDKINQRIMEKAMAGKSYMRPYQVMAAIVEGEAIVGYSKDFSDLEKFNKENRQQYDALKQQYRDALDRLYKSGSSTCAKEIELKNKYLPLFAQLNEEWQTRNLHLENTYFEDLLFWSYFAAADEIDAHARFYHWISNYLYKLNLLAQIEILEPCEVEEEPDEYEKQETADALANCSAKVSIPLGGGKLDIDCEKFSFKAGEGLLLRLEHNYVTKQTTWSIGLGAELYDGPASVAGKEIGGLDAKIHMSLYLTVDRFGNVADAGLISELKGSAKYGFEGSTKLKLKEDVGWKLGINTGFSMNEGRLKNAIDKVFGPEPEAPQQNRNIRIYRPD